MVGAANSVIGMKARGAVERFLSPVAERLKVENDGPAVFNSVMIETDVSTGLARSIERIDRRLEG